MRQIVKNKDEKNLNGLYFRARFPFTDFHRCVVTSSPRVRNDEVTSIIRGWKHQVVTLEQRQVANPEPGAISLSFLNFYHGWRDPPCPAFPTRLEERSDRRQRGVQRAYKFLTAGNFAKFMGRRWRSSLPRHCLLSYLPRLRRIAIGCKLYRSTCR